MDAGNQGRGGSAPRTTTLWRSFGHAWDGLVDATRGQRNMRIHLVAGILAGGFAALAPLGAMERGLIILCTALVIAAEGANTALESLVDLHGGPPSEPARIAKDAAAGAVLVLAVASVAVFGLVAAERWQALVASLGALLSPGAAVLGLAVLAALLVTPGTRGARGGATLAVAGALLVALLAATARCAPCASVPALLFAVAVAASRPSRAPSTRGRSGT